MDPLLPSLTRLSDVDLVVELARLAAREREATADLVAALMEFDARRLYLTEGCSSLFGYCTTRLHLSESAAYVRIEAARAARAHPLVLEALRSGSVTLTAIKLLAPHLTHTNHVDVLSAAAGLRTDDIKDLVARLAPRPDVPSSIRKLPEPKKPAADGDARAASPVLRLAAEDVAHDAPSPARAAASRPVTVAPARRAIVQSLAPARYQLQVTVSAEARATLVRLQNLLRAEIPSGDPAAIVERALGLLLAQVERQKFAALSGRTKRRAGPGTDATTSAGAGAAASEDAGPGATAKPTATTSPGATPATRPASPSAPKPRAAPRARQIPAAVRREVWRRDEGQCSYVSPAGQRCESRTFLEFHHCVAVADAGAATVENVRLLCAAHHRAESARVFAWRRAPEAGRAPSPTAPGAPTRPVEPT